jgi:hypothetical protein
MTIGRMLAARNVRPRRALTEQSTMSAPALFEKWTSGMIDAVEEAGHSGGADFSSVGCGLSHRLPIGPG